MKTKTLILIIIQTFLFGSVFIFTRMVFPPLNAYSYIFLRIGIGTIALLVYFFYKKLFPEFVDYVKDNFREILILSILAVVGMSLMFLGTPYTTSTNQSLLNSFCTVAIVVTNLLLYHKKPSKIILISTISTLFGIILVLIPVDFSQNDTIIGDMFTLAAMIAAAFWAIKNEKIMTEKPNALCLVMAVNIFSLIIIFPFIFLDNQINLIPTLSKNQWGIMIWLGVMISGFGYWINSELYADDAITAEHVSLFASLVLIFGVILGVIIYNDSLNIWNIIGIIFIVGAVGLSQKTSTDSKSNIIEKEKNSIDEIN